MDVTRLKSILRDVPGFPKPGILFRDITPLLADPEAFRTAIEALAEILAPLSCTKLAAMESRGFLLAAPLAVRLGKGIVPLRKPGKLPAATEAVSYDLEYGQATLEVHRDALTPGESVVIIDDLLATGGTARASGELIRKIGGTVTAYVFLIELADLGGRALLSDAPVFSLVTYP
jgi:adenine phosphoribosyltransferase